MNKETYIRIQKTLDRVNILIKQIQGLAEKDYDELILSLTWDLGYVIENVNLELFGCKTVTFCDLEYLEREMTSFALKDELAERYQVWKNTTAETLEQRYYAENIWDEKFLKLMDYVHFVDFDKIVEKARCSLLGQGEELVKSFCQYYQTFSGLWGTLDVSNDRYDVIINRVTALKDHRDDFIWLYKRLGDWRSRIVLCSMLYNWITFDLDYIRAMREGNFTDYFDLDLVKCGSEEVVVDLGAWIGDSVENYMQVYGKYKKIYCYEIDESNMREMKKNLGKYADIEYRKKAVGRENNVGYYEFSGPLSTTNRVTDSAKGKKTEIVSLDNDISERITLIKMDIEGAEQDALLGCVRHIKEEKPKLLVSVYHNNEDIWKIPRMIYEMNPEYRFYLRSNGCQWGPAEIVLLAI